MSPLREEQLKTQERNERRLYGEDSDTDGGDSPSGSDDTSGDENEGYGCESDNEASMAPS